MASIVPRRIFLHQMPQFVIEENALEMQKCILGKIIVVQLWRESE